jgi:hypothetical protein
VAVVVGLVIMDQVRQLQRVQTVARVVVLDMRQLRRQAGRELQVKVAMVPPTMQAVKPVAVEEKCLPE